jgi:hypothetical protein
MCCSPAPAPAHGRRVVSFKLYARPAARPTAAPAMTYDLLITSFSAARVGYATGGGGGADAWSKRQRASSCTTAEPSTGAAERGDALGGLGVPGAATAVVRSASAEAVAAAQAAEGVSSFAAERGVSSSSSRPPGVENGGERGGMLAGVENGGDSGGMLAGVSLCACWRVEK